MLARQRLVDADMGMFHPYKGAFFSGKALAAQDGDVAQTSQQTSMVEPLATLAGLRCVLVMLLESSFLFAASLIAPLPIAGGSLKR